MGFQLFNQQPQTFYSTEPSLPLIDPNSSEEDYDNQLKAHTFETLVRPLYTSQNSQQSASIKDDNTGGLVDPQIFTEALLHYLRTDVVDQELTRDFKSIYDKGSEHVIQGELSFDQFPLMEALSKEGLPYPEKGRVIYTPKEVIEAAGDFHDELDQIIQPDREKKHQSWFSKLGAYISQFNLSNFRLITLKDATAFEDLKGRMDAYIKQSGNLPKNTLGHLTQFKQLSLKGELSIGLFLPYELNHDPNGFNRLLEYELARMERKKNPSVFSEMYSIKGMLQPTKILLLNLDEYSDAKNLHEEWRSIVRAFNSTYKIRHIKNKQLQTIQSTNRDITATPDYEGGNRMVDEGAMRSDKISYLTKSQLSYRGLIKRIENIVKRQAVNQPTSNVTKRKRKTFMRANRRRPFDLNARGKVKHDHYRPDIHIWLDTSGSISQEDYQKQLQIIIRLAKKLNVDLYLNSFSHFVSETTYVATKNRSPKQIFKLIEQVDKVGGGTEFINVWKGIDRTEKANTKRGNPRRVHLILSDMDYGFPTNYTLQMNNPSVKNTHYIPIRTQTPASRKNIQRFAQTLAERGGPSVGSKRILF